MSSADRQKKNWSLQEDAGTAVVMLHKLFDASFYIEQNPDVASQAGVEPLTHYLLHGGLEDRDPHPVFDSSFYLQQVPQLRELRINPLVHYLEEGARLGLDPHPLFRTSFYVEQLPRSAERPPNPLIHYLDIGAKDGLDPHPLFDGAFYAQQVQQSQRESVQCTPLEHFLRIGAQQGLAPSPIFDSNAYLARYPDVAAAGLNPLLHYIAIGRTEGRVGLRLSSIADSLGCVRDKEFRSALAKLQAATAQKSSHLIVTGCLLRGGSERCASNIARAIGRKIGKENVLILVTDRSDMTCLDWLPENVRVLNLAEMGPSLSDEERGMLLVELLVRMQPVVAIGLNAPTLWTALDAHAEAWTGVLSTKLVAYLGNYETFVYDNESGFIDGPLRRLMKHLDLVITDNNRLRDTTIVMYSSEPSIKSKVVTCYKGLEENLYSALTSQSLCGQCESRSTSADSGRVRPSQVLWASRLNEVKQPHLISQIAEKLPDVQFAVYGRLMPRTTSIPCLDNSPNISLMGEYSDFAAIPKHDKDLLLYTSKADSMPHVLVEAGACGLPIIAPKIGAIGELINEHTGWLINRSDDVDEYVRVIQHVLDHPEAALERARNLAALIEQRHSWYAFTERLFGLYIW